MYMLLIAGILAVLGGIALIAAGIIQCRRRMENDASFLPADAEVILMDKKLRVHMVNFIPVFAFEFRPVLTYRTDGGSEVRTTLPFTLPVSAEYKDYKYAFDNRTPLPVKYDPASPDYCVYGSKRGFRIREALYKFIAGGIIIFIGVMLVYSHFVI